MSELNKNLEAVLLQYGYEASDQSATDDELVSMVRELAERMEDYENLLSRCLSDDFGVTSKALRVDIENALPATKK